MGGLVLHTESAVLGGLPFTSADFCDFCIHGPRMSIDDLSAPSESFVARVSGSVATVDRCPGRGRALLAADDAFASVLAVPTEVGTGSAKAPAAATTVTQPTPCSRSFTQGTGSVETAGPTVSAPVSPGSPASQTAKPSSDRISTRKRRRTATAASNSLPAVDYGFGPVGPLDHLPGVLTPRCGSRGRGRRRPPPRPLSLPLRRSPRCQTRLTVTTQRLWELLSSDLRLLLATRRLHLQS